MKYKITKICLECKGKGFNLCFSPDSIKCSSIKCKICNGTGEISEIVEIEKIDDKITDNKEDTINIDEGVTYTR